MSYRSLRVLLEGLALASLAFIRPAPIQRSFNMPLHLEINIPARTLDVIMDGTKKQSYPIAVGLPDYPTPIGTFWVKRVEWNPWWFPPHSAWVKDTTRQRPGPTNPMGKAKMRLAATYYIHGTADTASIGRAASHGCIRLLNADVIALASLLQKYAADSPAAVVMDSVVSQWSRAFSVPLRDSVLVIVRYDLAELKGDTLLAHPDVYSRYSGDFSEHVVAVLSEAGVDARRVDRKKLSLLVAGLSETRRILISSFLHPHNWMPARVSSPFVGRSTTAGTRAGHHVSARTGNQPAPHR